MKDVAHLVRTLMESTCVYVSKNISHEKDREAYIKAMRRCYYLCSTECSSDDVSAMLKAIEKLYKEAPATFIKRWELFSDTKRHYMLGVAHALDIVRTLNTKFITGSGHPDTIFIRNILGGSNEV